MTTTSIQFKVKDLIQQVNRVLIGNTFDFEEDRTCLIEMAISEWNQMPAIRFYEEGMCAKVKEQQMYSYAKYIGEEKENQK